MNQKTLVALLLSLASSPAVFAQTFICPTGPAQGQRQVGTTGGSPGLAPVPGCVMNGPSSSTPSASQPASPASDPMTSMARSQLGLVNEGAQILREKAELEKNPEIQKLHKGYWAFGSDKKNPRSGKECQAFFGSLTGSIQLSGPTATYDGAVMTFMGIDLPRPATPQQIRVDLYQDDAPVQNVSAISFVMPDSPTMGRLTFAMGSAKAMLNDMEDKYKVRVQFEGKEVVNTSYHSGNTARDFLRQCLAGKPAG